MPQLLTYGYTFVVSVRGLSDGYDQEHNNDNDDTSWDVSMVQIRDEIRYIVGFDGLHPEAPS